MLRFIGSSSKAQPDRYPANKRYSPRYFKSWCVVPTIICLCYCRGFSTTLRAPQFIFLSKPFWMDLNHHCNHCQDVSIDLPSPFNKKKFLLLTKWCAKCQCNLHPLSNLHSRTQLLLCGEIFWIRLINQTSRKSSPLLLWSQFGCARGGGMPPCGAECLSCLHDWRTFKCSEQSNTVSRARYEKSVSSAWRTSYVNDKYTLKGAQYKRVLLKPGSSPYYQTA